MAKKAVEKKTYIVVGCHTLFMHAVFSYSSHFKKKYNIFKLNSKFW